MATSTVQNGSISRDNLILNLDASNRGSYPGTGNIWFDISGYGNHFNLQNNPTSDGVKLTFNQNGGNQYAICQNTTCGNFGSSSFTVEIVYSYVTGSDQYPAVITKRSAMTGVASNNRPGFSWNPEGAGSNGVIFVVDNAGLLNNTFAFMGLPTPKNQILYRTMTVRRDGLNLTASLYQNTAISADNIQVRLSGSGVIDNNLAIQLAYSYGENDYMTGSLYYVRMYDRELSTSEIQQNYTLARNKYGF